MFLEIKNLSKNYRHNEGQKITVLKNISFEINSGKKIAIMGESGSGKSTLLYLLGLLMTPDSGEIWCQGENLGRLKNEAKARWRKKELGFVFQNFCLMAHLNILQNVLVALEYSDLNFEQREIRALEILKKVGLGERKNHQPRELSGGECQRAALARALVNGPRLILADEPTGNLDKASSGRVLELFDEFQKQDGIVVLVTHNVDVANFCEVKFLLKDGELLPF